jgi:lysozyme
MATNKQKGVAASIVAAMVISVPFIAGWEGKRNDPYRDMVGIMTVCYGETRVAMQRYSDSECSAQLIMATGDFMQPVLDCTPGLAERPAQLAAATSLAYNIGGKAYCGSTVARRFNAGDYKGACAAFLMWNKAGGRVVKGLVNRRKDEHRICMRGLA